MDEIVWLFGVWFKWLLFVKPSFEFLWILVKLFFVFWVCVLGGARPWWPDSPFEGCWRSESLTEGDVHCWGLWWGEKPCEVCREKTRKLSVECGCQSCPSETDPLWIPLPVILVLLIINLITCINSKKDVKCFKYFFGESDVYKLKIIFV